jgi:hypothetical protein
MNKELISQMTGASYVSFIHSSCHEQ